MNKNEEDSQKQDTSWKDREPHPPRQCTLCLCLTVFFFMNCFLEKWTVVQRTEYIDYKDWYDFNIIWMRVWPQVFFWMTCLFCRWSRCGLPESMLRTSLRLLDLLKAPSPIHAFNRVGLRSWTKKMFRWFVPSILYLILSFVFICTFVEWCEWCRCYHIFGAES